MRPEIVNALLEMGITNPTGIQEESLGLTLSGQSVLLNAETGSGKSLAFLLPLVQRLRNDEEVMGMVARPKRPRAVVLVPTRELGAQILGVAKGLSKYAKFSSYGAFGGSSKAQQAKRLNQPVDLLVATPGRLCDLVQDGFLTLGDVRFVVADEADTMASQGFGNELRRIFEGISGAANAAKEAYGKGSELREKLFSIQDSSSDTEELAATKQKLKILSGPFHPSDQGNVQLVLAAATVPEAVKTIVSSTFPRYREVKTARAHTVSDRVFQEFVSVSSSDRAMRLLEVVDRGQRMNMQRWAQARELDGATRDATIVFCNTKDSTMFVAKLLRENDFEVAEGHGWVPQSERLTQMEDFMSGKVKILVATDIVARGIDTVNVAHVINFDFPLNPVDYLHRIGRTGRGGGSGRVTNLIRKRDYTLAMAIERAAKLGQPIESLSSRRYDYVQGTPGLLKSESGPRKPRGDGAGKSRASKPGSRGAPTSGRGSGGGRRKPKDTTRRSFKGEQKGRR